MAIRRETLYFNRKATQDKKNQHNMDTMDTTHLSEFFTTLNKHNKKINKTLSSEKVLLKRLHTDEAITQSQTHTHTHTHTHIHTKK